MQTETSEKMGTTIKKEEKRKGTWGSRIYTFLASGGLILVLIGGFIIAVVIVSKLSK